MFIADIPFLLYGIYMPYNNKGTYCSANYFTNKKAKFQKNFKISQGIGFCGTLFIQTAMTYIQ